MRILIVAFLAMAFLVSCGDKEKKGRSRINYTMIKEKAEITGAEAEKFDKIVEEFSAKARELREQNEKENKETSKEDREKLAQEQDAKIKEILTAEQYAVYAEEIKIERTGREKYNVNLIKEELGLDSTQAAAYDLTNDVFYKTMRDNHDKYHGKPDVHKQFYDELDISRKEALKKVLTEEQFNKYLELRDKYKIGAMQGGR